MENLTIVKNKMAELEKEFNSGDTNIGIDVLTDYNSGYITDLYSEIADRNTEIYTKNLFDMAWDLYRDDYIDRVIEEFGEVDLVNILMAADYLRHEEELYNNDEAIRLYYALATLEDHYNQYIKNIGDIMNEVTNEDLLIFNRLEDIEDYVVDAINIYQ